MEKRSYPTETLIRDLRTVLTDGSAELRITVELTIASWLVLLAQEREKARKKSRRGSAAGS